MASGSSGRNNNSGPKGFDFGSDDILCSYDDNYTNLDNPNGSHLDKVSSSSSLPAHSEFQEFHKSRMAISSAFPATCYSPPGDTFNQDVLSTVEKTMKKHAENLMRFLEGISSRLSQLELYCYNLDKSIGEMRSDLICDHGEADNKLKSLEMHLQEVHRSVQILRDKQELADAQKELTKLQLGQKESFSPSHSQQNEEKAAPPASDPTKADNSSDVHGQQLALALTHQVSPQPQLPTRSVEQQQPLVAPSPQMSSQTVGQPQAYYVPSPQIPNPPPRAQQSQSQYLPSDAPYLTPQMQDMSRMAPQPMRSVVNQTSQVQPQPQYQLQWLPQLPQHVRQPQQSSMQPHIRPPSTAIYPAYTPSQSSSPETPTGSMPMQLAFSGVSQPGGSRAESMLYGYGGPGRPVQSQPSVQHVKANFGASQEDGFAVSGPQASISLGNAYMIYDEGGRTNHSTRQPHFPHGHYPSSSLSFQNPQSSATSFMARPPQFMHNHPHSELIEKLVNMGYGGDHIINVIQRLEESGQPVDFNAVLDRLNGHSSGGSQGGWSG